MHSNPAARRRHSPELKAKVLAACNEPGASIAAVAMAHGLNANLVRKWRVGRGMKTAIAAGPTAVESSSSMMLPPAAPALPAADARFVPIELTRPTRTSRAHAASQGDADAIARDPIHVELQRGPLRLSVRWPTSAAGDCLAWLRELASGLAK